MPGYIALTHCTIPGAAEEIADIVAALKRRRQREAEQRAQAMRTPKPPIQTLREQLADVVARINPGDEYADSGEVYRAHREAMARADHLRAQIKQHEDNNQ